MNSNQFQEAIRHMRCMGEKEFCDAFGEEAPYLIEKFFGELDRNIVHFICYLDSNNMRALYEHCVRHNERFNVR